MTDTRDPQHIEAILTIATRELERVSWRCRCGAWRSLLEQSMPFLREMAKDLRDREADIEKLRRKIAVAESNASERSDPGSNEENDETILKLRDAIGNRDESVSGPEYVQRVIDAPGDEEAWAVTREALAASREGRITVADWNRVMYAYDRRKNPWRYETRGAWTGD